jgi:hypothetical protein
MSAPGLQKPVSGHGMHTNPVTISCLILSRIKPTYKRYGITKLKATIFSEVSPDFSFLVADILISFIEFLLELIGSTFSFQYILYCCVNAAI